MSARVHPATILRSVAIVLAVVLGGCAGGGGLATDGGTGIGRAGAERVPQCRAGDTRVASEASCLQDDAACYALDDGGFCTGPRGDVCPSGSSAVPDGAACPPGERCFRISESLECRVIVD